MAVAAKQHDTSKDTGRKANVFEQQAVDQTNDKLKEAEIKKKQDIRRQELEEKRKQVEEEKKKVSNIPTKLSILY